MVRFFNTVSLLGLFVSAEANGIRGRNRPVERPNKQTPPAAHPNEHLPDFAIKKPLDRASTDEPSNPSRNPPTVYYSSQMAHIMENYTVRPRDDSRRINFGAEVMLASTSTNEILNRHYGTVQGTCRYQNEEPTACLPSLCFQCDLTWILGDGLDDTILASGEKLVFDSREEVQVLRIVDGTGLYGGERGDVRLTFLGDPFEGTHEIMQVDFDMEENSSLTN